MRGERARPRRLEMAVQGTRLVLEAPAVRLVQDRASGMFMLELWSMGQWRPVAAAQHYRSALQRLGPAIDQLAGQSEQEAEY